MRFSEFMGQDEKTETREGLRAIQATWATNTPKNEVRRKKTHDGVAQVAQIARSPLGVSEKPLSLKGKQYDPLNMRLDEVVFGGGSVRISAPFGGLVLTDRSNDKPDVDGTCYSPAELANLYHLYRMNPEAAIQVHHAKEIFDGSSGPVALVRADLNPGVLEVMLCGGVPIVGRWSGRLVTAPWKHVAQCGQCGPVPYLEAATMAECVWCAFREVGYRIPAWASPEG